MSRVIRVSIVSVSALLLMYSSSLQAHDRDRDGSRHRLGRCVLAEFDLDGDGQLNEEELAAAVEARKAEILAEFDVDGDGELSDEERATAREARRADRMARREARRAELLAEFDADGDGELSEDERAAAHEARRAEILAEFDVDGDGELSDEERAAARAARCEDMSEAEAEADAIVEALALSREFIRGEVNEDGTRNLADAVAVLNYLFRGEETPLCIDSADANDDGSVNIADALTILALLFGDGASLPEPFAAPGVDPTLDELPCDG